MFPQEFMTMRKNILVGRGRRNYASKYYFPGVYILHNVTKDKYYIGQGRQVLDRVNMLFQDMETAMYMQIISTVISLPLK